MAKYRKKPVVIEAFKLGIDGWPEWFSDAVTSNKVITHALIPEMNDPFESNLSHAEIETLEGVHRADLGDFIIKGVKGEFYPCKPDIFAMTYEAVED